MTVVFNGMIEKQTKGGCKCRGNRSEYSFVARRMFILPSGKEQTFVRGRETEVSDQDGEFLLSYSYTDSNGAVRNVFTEV